MQTPDVQDPAGQVAALPTSPPLQYDPAPVEKHIAAVVCGFIDVMASTSANSSCICLKWRVDRHNCGSSSKCALPGRRLHTVNCDSSVATDNDAPGVEVQMQCLGGFCSSDLYDLVPAFLLRQKGPVRLRSCAESPFDKQCVEIAARCWLSFRWPEKAKILARSFIVM